MNRKPVSYTHLDVYKRQVYDSADQLLKRDVLAHPGFELRLRHALSAQRRRVTLHRKLPIVLQRRYLADDFTPVSYTHLDVYKRQGIVCVPAKIIELLRALAQLLLETVEVGRAHDELNVELGELARQPVEP